MPKATRGRRPRRYTQTRLFKRARASRPRCVVRGSTLRESARRANSLFKTSSRAALTYGHSYHKPPLPESVRRARVTGADTAYPRNRTSSFPVTGKRADNRSDGPSCGADAIAAVPRSEREVHILATGPATNQGARRNESVRSQGVRPEAPSAAESDERRRRIEIGRSDYDPASPSRAGAPRRGPATPIPASRRFIARSFARDTSFCLPQKWPLPPAYRSPRKRRRRRRVTDLAGHVRQPTLSVTALLLAAPTATAAHRARCERAH